MAKKNLTAHDLILRHLHQAPGHCLPWHEVMTLALYAPGVGYYRQGVRRIGRGGDFITNVSVGPLYGELLAESCASIWRQMGSPEDFCIMEQGANDGQLASDVLKALQTNHPDLFSKVQYCIIEPDEEHRSVQWQMLGDKLNHISGWSKLKDQPEHAVLICNELLDAFTVHRVRYTEGRWQEMAVHVNAAGELSFIDQEITSDELIEELTKHDLTPEEGMIIEVNLGMLQWLKDIAQTKFRGALLIADYGEAGAGDTLRRYIDHHCDSEVLEDLGESDLTTHVNFTRLAEEALECGFEMVEFIEQGRFLTRQTTERMQRSGFKPDPSWMRQFQSLTHPTHLGFSFQIMLLAKGYEATTFSSASNIEAAIRRLSMPALAEC
jgi:SAM-dependent MidA family methyltransferase